MPFAACALACAGPPRVSRPPTVSPEALHDACELSRAQLDALARRPSAALKQELSISVVEATSGRGFEGRGVVLVRPRTALRMILLGPGGTTAMDVWIAEGRFRVAIPAIDRVVRGDAATSRKELRGLPIDLLWRWLVDPFGGALVHARREGDGFVAYLRRGAGFEIRRRTSAGGEGWFFERGRLVGAVRAREVAVGDALFPIDVDYEADEPAMRVRVRGAGVAEVAEVSARVFADPDVVAPE